MPGNGINLQVRFTPNSLKRQWTDACKLRLYVAVAADGAKSDEIVIDIAWDGQWHEGQAEMAKHLIIKQVKNT
ncbi:MAG: hypothetical protein GY841_14060 [FCB group bacterium]|nr:hypothetical protein [FCB group bacterium]